MYLFLPHCVHVITALEDSFVWDLHVYLRHGNMCVVHVRSKAAIHLMTSHVLPATVFQVCFCSSESAAVTSLAGFEWWDWRGRQRETVGVEPEKERG